MVQWVLYLDETGTPDAHTIPVPDGKTPVFTLAGVMLPLDRWREYDRAYLYLKREFFRKEIDGSSKIDAAWEVKGSSLLGPRNAGSERNKAFTHRVLDLIQSFDGKVVGVSFVKGVRKPMPKTSIYTKGLQIIAERFDRFLSEHDATGILVLDSRMAHTKKGTGLDYTVATSYLSFIFGNKEGKLLKRIVEAPMFADSGLTAGLQIADVVSAIVYTNIYRQKLAPTGADQAMGYLDYTHTARYWNDFKRLIFESEGPEDSHRMYGLRNFDQRDHVSDAEMSALQERFGKRT